MKNRTDTIRQTVNRINRDKDGIHILDAPGVETRYTWGEESTIEKLFDSVTRGYPIGSFLIWEPMIKLAVKRAKFVTLYESASLGIFSTHRTENAVPVVVDGLQRLQSLFTGLRGFFDWKELYFDTLSGLKNKKPREIKYVFKFRERAEAGWVKMKDLVFAKDHFAFRRKFLDKLPSSFGDAEKGPITKNLYIISRAFDGEDRIICQELDDDDFSPNKYTVSDIIEMRKRQIFKG